MGDCHARFCESPRVKSPRATHLTTFKALQKLAPVLLATFAVIGVTASPALAGEAHPFLHEEFGHNATEAFSNPNGIAIDESTGDVYVADIGTDTVYKFDANGNPVNFSFPAGSKEAPGNTLEGADTPAGSFSFPTEYGTSAAIAVDNACVQHSPALTGRDCEEFDPSAGDLYVMDAGNGVIDKFSPEGRYLNQIGGFPPATGSFGSEGVEGELLGLGVDGSGTVDVDLRVQTPKSLVEQFDDGVRNHLVARQLWQTKAGGLTPCWPTAMPCPPRAIAM